MTLHENVKAMGEGRMRFPALSVFERYLTLWVFALHRRRRRAGPAFPPDSSRPSARLEVARVNLPVGVLIWVMIIPMLMKVDFGALGEVAGTRAASA